MQHQADFPVGDDTAVAREVVRRFGDVRRVRQPFEAMWDDVALYMGQGDVGFAEARSGDVRRPDVLDATARRAADIFAAGMLSGACSPSQRWFALALDDADLADRPAVRAWLQDVEDIFYAVLAEGGFYREQALAYHQSGLFGWQCLYVDESPTGGVRFRALPLSEVFIAENAQGEVDTVFRRFRMRATDAARRWGADALSEAMRRALADTKRQNEEFTLLHAVFPRPQGSARMPGNCLPFASYYVELGDAHLVSEGGYDELPYVVARFRRLPGTPYSASPGTEALADVKMLNEMKRLILEAGQLAVAPPYLVPDDGFVGRFSFEPRAMNYYRRAEGNSLADFGPLSVGGDPRFSWELMQSTRQDINAAFFVDLFMTIRSRVREGAAPTALEVAELASERMFLLGPLLVNQQQENFARLFDRLHRLLLRRGELPPAPAELDGMRLRAEYVSPLMLAQKEARSQSVLQTYRDAGAMAALAPSVLDNFDHDENLRRIMESRGFPQRGMRSRAAVRRLREERAQAEAQATQDERGRELLDAAAVYPALSRAAEPGSPARIIMETLGG
ncbi:hypothetical protein GGQ74_002197 [Desulfobaculum xiamenense]|uniref:Bacteriophage head to tail connecting protein n=1 Tax=Desulfobaculum xiamenense TaxID=995050 RepID=A0A846QTM1_9BACT|nr:portal protein [Desulfobaculum xiamenense]NJB68524.1 hypothetical protein [Desulfobaculum xiamenense]